MVNQTVTLKTTIDRKKLLNLFESGRFSEAENYLDELFDQSKKSLLKSILKYFIPRRATREIANEIGRCNNYLRCELTMKTITVKGGIQIKIPSYYALSKKKKMGPKKTGANGRGNHLLLSYWGFIDDYSPGHWEEVCRIGAASMSYDLAAEELTAQGISTSSTKVGNLVQKVGEKALKHGVSLVVGQGESVKGKKICISLDGGRIRTRQWKEGRPKKGHEKGFVTPWIEPKLLCIYEFTDKGEMKKGEKPIYYATIDGPEKLYNTLLELSILLKLKSAEEIVCIADGSDWIWNIFARLVKELHIEDKTTQVADYFHAVEHLSQIAVLATDKTEKEKLQWVGQLAKQLKQGKFAQVKEEVEKSENNQMIKEFAYFEKRQDKMRYDTYIQRYIPIGSGAVESAVKRVINQRIKATGSFWLKENVERFLSLRCALISGRWNIFVDNLISKMRLTYNAQEKLS